MGKRRSLAGIGFWALALLWLPCGILATAAVRFATGAGPSPEPVKWVTVALMSAQSLIYVVPCGLPLAMACRRLSRLGYRRAAWVAGIGLGAVTALASLVAGLLGPVAILIYALVLSVPVWIAAWWLARRN